MRCGEGKRKIKALYGYDIFCEYMKGGMIEKYWLLTYKVGSGLEKERPLFICINK